jgi:hypothetical protein
MIFLQVSGAAREEWQWKSIQAKANTYYGIGQKTIF